MLKVEFHCHTDASKDSLTTPHDLIEAARRKGLDRLIITDHNSIAGAAAAQALDPQLVIIGEEIMTTRGELLASFVKEEIPAHLSPKDTIRLLKGQGAFISVSHPFDEIREGGWQERDLLEIVPEIDAIEVYNSRCMYRRFNERARQFAEVHYLAGTVGSDAHAAFEVGRSVLMLDAFASADEMRAVIRNGIPHVRWSPWWVHLFSHYASTMKRFKS